MADETDPAQTVDDVIVGFQKALGRAWRASEDAMKADPGIAGGTRQLFGVSQLDIELACVIQPHPNVPDRLTVRLDPPAGQPASVLRFRVEAKPVNSVNSTILTLSKAEPRPGETDVVLLANLLDERSEGKPGVTVQFELSRPGLAKAVKQEKVTTDVRGQAAMTVSLGALEPAAGMRLAGRALRLADVDRKIRILARATAQTERDQFDRVLRTEWTEFTFDRASTASSGGGPAGDGSIGGPVFGPEV